MTVIAHAADWIATGVFLAPVLGFLAWLGLTSLCERRAQRGNRPAEPAPPRPQP